MFLQHVFFKPTVLKQMRNESPTSKAWNYDGTPFPERKRKQSKLEKSFQRGLQKSLQSAGNMLANARLLKMMASCLQRKKTSSKLGAGVGTLYNMRILLGKPALSPIPAKRSSRVLRKISYKAFCGCEQSVKIK